MARWLRILPVVTALLVAGPAAHADPLALWHVVHDRCVRHFLASGSPAPCRRVAMTEPGDRGDAVLKDLRGATQFLLIPTSRVTGIEDPAVLAPGAPNYFADAWKATALVSRRAGVALPRNDLSLAINAPTARTQDQLHIHVDCVRADVRATLRRLAPKVGPAWTALPGRLGGARWRARRIDGAHLVVNPFRLLADGPAAAEMRRHTLVLVGMIFAGGAPGFILLDARTDPPSGFLGDGEILQDHGCAVARR